jgi:2-dehydro-3-deoxyphosphogluconate aldolase/(4S)-4-hydroxy-2-oxoglutarate aldolase
MNDPTREQIQDSGVIAVLRGVTQEQIVDVADAVVDGGVTALEVTADTPGAMEMIEELAGRFREEDVFVGAGTVLDSETARSAQLAGASFIVSPTFDPDLVEICNRYDTLVAPGVFTPTEAQRAFEAGADLVKLFPAKNGGPEHLAAIKGPLPQLPIVPTGGVGPDNAGEYIDAGAVAVGAGGAIVPEEALQAGDFQTITENARALVEAVEAARGSQ